MHVSIKNLTYSTIYIIHGEKCWFLEVYHDLLNESFYTHPLLAIFQKKFKLFPNVVSLTSVAIDGFKSLREVQEEAIMLSFISQNTTPLITCHKLHLQCFSTEYNSFLS